MKRTEGSLDYIFQKIAQGKPDNLSLTQADTRVSARKWVRQKASEITSVSVPNIVRRVDDDRLVRSMSYDNIGQMLMFMYDAKLKKELPFWDRFPLIFPIEIYGDGFLGINLHYLPPMYRAKLMDALYTTVSNHKYDETTKLRISYNILKEATKFRYFKPCVKRYLSGHVQTQFIKVQPDEWDMALLLPTERFQKARKQTVWADSVTKINKRKRP